MAGHNKFSKIKHKKAATDAKKSKIFGMHAKAIAIKSKEANGDVNSPPLRAAIEKAKRDNMPNDNIDRAVKKGAGGEGDSFTEVMYEGFGPAGIALIVEGITDNTNRTVNDVKHIFSKQGFSLGVPGSAAWAFTKNDEGNWVANDPIEASDQDLEKLAKLVEALEDNDDVKEVYTSAA